MSAFEHHAASIAAAIKRHGSTVQLRSDSDKGLDIGVTIGLWRTYQHPEVLVIGPSWHEASEMLERLRRDVHAGRRFAPGSLHHGIVPSHVVAVLPTDPAVGHWFGVPTRFYGAASYPALQLFWPDPQGRFPWIEGYDELAWPQPRPWDDCECS